MGRLHAKTISFIHIVERYFSTTLVACNSGAETNTQPAAGSASSTNTHITNASSLNAAVTENSKFQMYQIPNNNVDSSQQMWSNNSAFNPTCSTCGYVAMNIMAPQNASYQIESHSQTTIPISNVVVTNKYGQLPLTNALYLENTKDIFMSMGGGDFVWNGAGVF